LGAGRSAWAGGRPPGWCGLAGGHRLAWAGGPPPGRCDGLAHSRVGAPVAGVIRPGRGGGVTVGNEGYPALVSLSVVDLPGVAGPLCALCHVWNPARNNLVAERAASGRAPSRLPRRQPGRCPRRATTRRRHQPSRRTPPTRHHPGCCRSMTRQESSIIDPEGGFRGNLLPITHNGQQKVDFPGQRSGRAAAEMPALPAPRRPPSGLRYIVVGC
jgi:hypothetical protein